MFMPLNIITSYPVHWSKYQVLRDFIQNFYDSVGSKDFLRRFCYKYSSGQLSVWVEGVSFRYEWLLHIGASTKQDELNKAGFFGEGFKIAALCALRDHGWSVYMRSGDWELDVITCDYQIDGRAMKMLGYDVRSISLCEKSQLVISGFDEADYTLFKDVIVSFYYPENPLFGELIWEGEIGAVFSRSKIAIPYALPSTFHFGPKGCVYCAYQMLGTNPFDLVVCLHDYRNNDRERGTLYDFDVIDVMTKIASRIDSPDSAMKMLIKMRRNWNSRKKKKIDLYSWSPVIDALVYRVSRSASVSAEFRRRFPDLLYATKLRTVSDSNRRKQARCWLKSQDRQYVIVRETFRCLGYDSLEYACERDGGFVVDELPTGREQTEGFKIIEKTIIDVFGPFFYFPEGLPTPKIINNDTASYHGMAVCHKLTRPIPTGFGGLSARSKISAIYLKAGIFCRAGFYDALSTYVHEACHMFGGDASQAYSLSLTLAIEILLMNHERVAAAAEYWDHLFPIDDEAHILQEKLHDV